MHSLVVLYPWPDDPAKFKDYYRTKHIPLAAKLPGLRGYSYGYPQALGPGKPEHFCVFEARFDNLDSMLAALDSEQGKTVAAVCHAPWLLIETGLAKGRRMTSYHSIKADVMNAGAKWEDSEVVVDQGVITSRNPGDLEAFSAKIIEEVGEGRHERRAVA